MKDLFDKIEQSIKLIRSVKRAGDVVVAYSGGKDSDVMRRLCELAQVPFTLVYNSTTIDPPGTLARNIRMGAVIQRPSVPFLQLLKRKGLPSLNRRWCCQVLKEQYIAPRLLLGVRASESVKRKQRYIEPTACRVFTKVKHCDQIYPILNWTNSDVEQFINDFNVEVHPLYYVNGKFDVNQRLGCIGCPLLGDRGKRDFLQYPKMLRQWVKCYTQYVSTHKAIEGVYEDILWHIFYSNHKSKQYNQSFHGIFEAPNAKQILEDYFKVDL